jgi:hypothetical protein
MNLSQEMIDFYNESKSLRKVAAKFKINRARVTILFKEKGIKINQSCRDRKASIKSNIFDDLNEESAYWLGFLYADGYLDETRDNIALELGIQDLKHLEEFAEFVGYNKPVKYRVDKPTCYIHFSDKVMVRSLIKNQLRQKKSFTAEFPEMKKHLIFHFISGYFDGDGSVYYVGKMSSGLNVIGSESFITSLHKIVGFGKTRKVPKVEGMCYFELTNNPDVMKFYNQIYKSNFYRLKRKQDKFKFIVARSSTTKLPPSSKKRG